MSASRVMDDQIIHSDQRIEGSADDRRFIEEKEARNGRVRIVADDVRQFCFAGLIQSSILSETGELIDVPRESWGGREFDIIQACGETSVWRQRLVTGRVLLNLVDLDKQFSTPDSSPEHEPLPYLSPFILYMMRASRELGLSENERVPKKEVVAWLRLNWPPDLGECSEDMVQYMATLLRRPEDKMGGLVKHRRSTKGSDPSSH